MPTIKDPTLFSDHFNIDPDILKRMNIFNPLLNVDTNLFIDPLILNQSMYSEINLGAVETYEQFFTKIIKLLTVSNRPDDLPWRNARRLLNFPEIKATCLGYGAGSISGSSWGPLLSSKVLNTAKEIISLGISDPDLFMALSLFEEGMGPDRISDMVTNIIFKDLIKFNLNILQKMPSIKTCTFDIDQKKINLPANPFEKKPTPIILLPLDILRDLPIATDWSEVGNAAAENEDLRIRVSTQIGDIWKRQTTKDKLQLKNQVLSSHANFQLLLQLIKDTKKAPYDFILDQKGEVAWVRILESDLKDDPLNLFLRKNPTADEVFKIVKSIVEQFKNLIENKGLWKEMWAEEKVRPEKSAQRLFFAVADTYCKANNLDLTPEADSGNGPVDFKFSSSYSARVLVEVKLSKNKVVHGYQKQLERYKSAEDTLHAIYLVIDVGNMGKKDENIIEIKNSRIAAGLPTSDIVFVDSNQKLSASKL